MTVMMMKMVVVVTASTAMKGLSQSPSADLAGRQTFHTLYQ